MVWANNDLRKNPFPVQILISAAYNVIKLKKMFQKRKATISRLMACFNLDGESSRLGARKKRPEIITKTGTCQVTMAMQKVRID